MPHDESLYPAAWLRIAEKDWKRAKTLSALKDYGAAGFFLQQAVEKFLKAFLLSKKQDVPPTDEAHGTELGTDGAKGESL